MKKPFRVEGVAAGIGAALVDKRDELWASAVAADTEIARRLARKTERAVIVSVSEKGGRVERARLRKAREDPSYERLDEFARGNSSFG
jgi:hypothetical protein